MKWFSNINMHDFPAQNDTYNRWLKISFKDFFKNTS